MIRIKSGPERNHSSAVNRLKNQFSWPACRPSVRPIDWCLDAGGKKLVTELLQELPPGSVVLEIGSFIGGSAKLWLQSSQNITVICLDPWELQGSIRDFAKRQRQPDWVIEQLDQTDGIYQTFLANLWDYRERVIPIRGYSQDALQMIADAGISPDLIYLDADKTGREIEPCHRLFPQAKITGDDWWFGIDRWWRPDEGYPIRRPVREFCKRHNHFLRTDKMTWVIDREKPSMSYQLRRPLYHFKTIRRRLRGLFRAAIGREKLT